MQTLNISYVARLFMIYGALSGVISGIIYAWNHGGSQSALNILLVMLVAPIAQGASLATLAAVGYPIYHWLSRKNHLKLGEIEVLNNNDADQLGET